MQALVIAGGVLPLASMLARLFAAIWIRVAKREREREAVASRSHSY